MLIKKYIIHKDITLKRISYDFYSGICTHCDYWDNAKNKKACSGGIPNVKELCEILDAKFFDSLGESTINYVVKKKINKGSNIDQN